MCCSRPCLPTPRRSDTMSGSNRRRSSTRARTCRHCPARTRRDRCRRSRRPPSRLVGGPRPPLKRRSPMPSPLCIGAGSSGDEERPSRPLSIAANPQAQHSLPKSSGTRREWPLLYKELSWRPKECLDGSVRRNANWPGIGGGAKVGPSGVDFLKHNRKGFCFASCGTAFREPAAGR